MSLPVDNTAPVKIIVVVGARPNFVKVAPILRAMQEHNLRGSRQITPLLVHTGQHYDAQMSDAFFSDLNLPNPDIFLGVGSGSHAVQTADVMCRFEEVLLREKPDVLIVVGDVNSTLACALVAAKLPSSDSQPRPLIAHVEAGLRSFDRAMPEEINRVLTDHLSDFLFITEASGSRNLKAEGIPEDRIFFVGNTMIDSLLAVKDKADQSTVLERLGLGSARAGEGNANPEYALLTLHRPSNVDTAENFVEILEGLQELAHLRPIVFPVHPRTKKQIDSFGFSKYFSSADKVQGKSGDGKITMTGAQGYLDFLCLMKNASLVVTDSGGIQEETTCLGVPCVTVRENTERPVTIENGTNILAGVSRQGIRSAITRQLGRRVSNAITPPLWDGQASGRIVEVLTSNVDARRWSAALAASTP